MSNGLGDFPYGMVTNVKASVLPYKDLGESHAMTHGASEEGHCLKGGWLLHPYGLGMSEGVAVQRGVDIGPQVVDLYLAV